MAAHAHSAHGHDHGPVYAHADPNSPFHIKHPKISEYIIVYVALLVLLVITVALYSIDLSKNPLTGWIPGVNLIVALIVASIKAALVVAVFMNVKGGTKLIVLWALLGFIWLPLIAGIFMDYQTRAWVDQSGWQSLPSSESPTNTPEGDSFTTPR